MGCVVIIQAILDLLPIRDAEAIAAVLLEFNGETKPARKFKACGHFSLSS
jgi:hypothetical protein